MILGGMNGISNHKGDPTEPVNNFCNVRIQQKVCNVEDSPYLTMQALWSQTSRLRTLRNKVLLFINFPVCSILV